MSPSPLETALIGRTIAALEARQLGDADELEGLILDDGTRLSFAWHVGSSHRRVGLRVHRPEAGEVVTASPRESAEPIEAREHAAS